MTEPKSNPMSAKTEENKEENGSSTSDEYEVVSTIADTEGGSPKLDIVVGQGKGEDLEKNINDCLNSSPEEMEQQQTKDNNNGSQQQHLVQGLANLSVVEDESEHTMFHDIVYLGSIRIENPKNEECIQSQIRSANQITSDESNQEEEEKMEKVRKEVTLSVPRHSDGLVIMREKNNESNELHRFSINKIIFFARGNVETPESTCFAFTCVHGAVDLSETGQEEAEARHFKTHIYRCQVPEAVSKVFLSFAQAFKRSNPIHLRDGEAFHEQESFLFEVTMDVKERDEASKTFDNVPRHKGIFKLRSNVEKKVVFTIQQISNNSCMLQVERCFGMLVSPGRNVRHADMQLLEHVTMATSSTMSQDNKVQTITHVITGQWDPSETAFALLNQETHPDIQSVYMTLAADLVIQQVTEPVRFIMETKARIFPSTEKYWYFAKRNLCKQYQVRLKSTKNPQGEKVYEVCGIDVSEEIDRSKMSLTMQLANLTASTWGNFRSSGSASISSEPSTEPLSPVDNEEDSGGEETILSGFGDVSKDCSGTELEMWSQVISEWDTDNPLQYPKQLSVLVKRGVPEALRGEVWQRVAGISSQMEDIIETYRQLTTKESPDEKVILRDIHRTFPAHEFFKEAGGVGQESLYRISKAYSIYDSEVGYCQGQSFLIAALLLQMPEEQAFGVLVKVMHRWGLRDMFKENFELLQLRLYQLDRLIETSMPDLWNHFESSGIESHMYASQWFLTIFTAKFPLFLVFRVLDCFLLFGFDSIFQVALAMLKSSKKDLLNLDFEGLMRYFRVNIPKRYRSEENAKSLMTVANGIKLKKLNKYEKEWMAIKAQERAREDPLVRYERENKKLLNDNMRLDTENDNLARQLVNSKIEMRQDIDKAEDEKDFIEKEYQNVKLLYAETVEEKKRLEIETEQLKGLLKREVEKLETELVTRNNVIADYKIITSQLSEKLEKLQARPASYPPKSTGDATDEVDENQRAEEVRSALAEARVRELELELAQTKLRLVETECLYQDVSHQFSQELSQQQLGSQSLSKGGKWLTKTLSSIKESAVSHAPVSAQSLVRNYPTNTTNTNRDPLKKSTSVDALKNE